MAADSQVSAPLQPDASADPPFDNFYSPRNASFYASKTYTPLHSEKKELRLIKLFPGRHNGPVKCELLPPQPLEEASSTYLALSYCAGDPNVTTSIQVNQLSFNAFANLEVALRRLRASSEEIERRRQHQLLWVDQVCIDQSNPTERAHQVGFMREIYQEAERVIIWLGGDGTEGQGLRWLVEQYGNLKELVRNLDIENQDDPETFAATEYCAEMIGQLLVNDHFNDPKFVRQWMALLNLAFSPWWSRSWVAQELIVSRDATIMFGKVDMPWSEFKVAFKIPEAMQRALVMNFLQRDADDQHVTELARSMIGGRVEFPC